MTKKIADILRDKAVVALDIGCGANKMPGTIGMDMQNLPGVDIVHDLEDLPWPLPDNSVDRVTASHILEHINPHKGVFINVMNEIWRITKPRGQFAFVVPHGESPGYIQDPTHCNQINETTMHYFDPDPERDNIGPALYNFYRPKPWKIVKQYFSYQGNLEVLLEKRPWDKTYDGDYPPMDITKEPIQ